MADTTASRLSPDGRWRWDGTAWVPVGGPRPGWLSLDVRTPATWRIVVAASSVAVLGDQALRAPSLGAGAAVAIAAAAMALALGGVRRPEGRLLLGLAAVFGGCLALRSSLWLAIPDLAASAGLLAIAASIGARGSLLDLGFAEAAARVAHGLLQISAGIPYAGRPLLGLRSRLEVLAPVARGLLLAVPAVAVIGWLLASADPVFASFFTFNVDPAQLARDAAYLAAAGFVMSGLLRLANAGDPGPVLGPRRRLGMVEGLVVVGLLDAVFAAFAVAQAVAAAGSGAEALQRAGMTYAEYARSGFFQLLWVAAITLPLLVVCSRVTDAGRGRGRALLQGLTWAAIALTLLVVYVAFRRLGLYEDAYGFTMLRLFSHLFAVWIGLVFLLLAVDLASPGLGARWFLGASLGAGLAILLVLNVISPEALVVRLNTGRAVATHKLDAGYLQALGSDAVPALDASMADLPPDLRAQVRAALCGGARSYDAPWAAFNAAGWQAAAVRRRSC